MPRAVELAADGEADARRVLEMLEAELEHAMVLAGVPDVGSIGPGLLGRRRGA